MQELTLDALERCFKRAYGSDYNYVAVRIETEGHPGPEIIINPIYNAHIKMEYYRNTYNDDLTHKHAPLRISGFTYGVDFDDIQDDLMY